MVLAGMKREGALWVRGCFPRSHLDVSGGGQERLRPSALDEYVSKPGLSELGINW